LVGYVSRLYVWQIIASVSFRVYIRHMMPFGRFCIKWSNLFLHNRDIRTDALAIAFASIGGTSALPTRWILWTLWFRRRQNYQEKSVKRAASNAEGAMFQLDESTWIFEHWPTVPDGSLSYFKRR
jgi:hypothetical protein